MVKPGNIIVEAKDITVFTKSGGLLLDHIGFQLQRGHVYGLIGSNGCGKTTLLNIISGTTQLPFEGELVLYPSLCMEYLQQNVVDSLEYPMTVKEFLMQEYNEHNRQLESIERALSFNHKSDDLAGLLNEYQLCLDSFEKIGGERYPAEVDKILNTIGYQSKAHICFEVLSGGEKKILYILKNMLLNPDLLLMDEPEAFLDMENIAVLEKLISKYRNTILMVSHNRQILDACCDRILLLENHKIIEYKGNYSYFKYVQLSKKVAQQRKAFYDRKNIIEQQAIEQRYAEIASKVSDPSWGKRLRARRKLIERLQNDATAFPYVQIKKIMFEFNNVQCDSETVLSVNNYIKRFGNLVLFKGANMSIKGGEKVAIWGRNGSGKTTLLRDIIASQAIDIPAITIKPSLRIGYLPQVNEAFELDEAILDNFIRLGIESVEKVCTLLKLFLFSPQDLNKKVGTLSGGELKFLQLALLSYYKYDLLIMDEPTSNLDIFSQEAVEEAINKYDGTVLLASHDLNFIENVAERIFVIENGMLIEYNFQEFKQKVLGDIYDKEKIDHLEYLQQKKRLLEKSIDIALFKEDYKTSRELVIDLAEIVQEMTSLQKIY